MPDIRTHELQVIAFVETTHPKISLVEAMKPDWKNSYSKRGLKKYEVFAYDFYFCCESNTKKSEILRQLKQYLK